METTSRKSFLFSNRSENLPPSFIRNILKIANQADVISFAGGLPDPALFPLRELEESAAASFRIHGLNLLQYSQSEGLPALREWICRYYKANYKMEVKPEQVFITNGSQQALDLIGKAFLNPGDELILEQPSYLGAIQAFMVFEPSILPLPIYSDGLDLTALEIILNQHTPKFLYLVPNFQNPSGFSISKEKREALVALAGRHHLTIIEDDPYGQLRFQGEDLPPIRAQYPGSILCGSLSKIVAPGLRIGWVIAEEQVIRRLLILKQASDLHCNNLSQYIAAHFLQNYSFSAHLEKIRNNYREKARIMFEAALKYFPPDCRILKPTGGMFLWVELPGELDAEELLKRCMEEKVLFVPGKYFYSNGNGYHTLRLNFTNSSGEKIEKGMKVLGMKINELMKESLQDSLINAL